MNSKTYMKVLAASFLVGVGLSFVACGASNNSAPGANAALVPNSISCGAGQYNVNGATCVAGASFQQACWYSGGRILPVNTIGNSVELCRTDQATSRSFQVSYIPILSPAAPQDPSAVVDSSFLVYPGDRILIRGVQGGWGTVKSLLGGALNYANCSSNSASGAEGLNLSDGVGVYSATKGSTIVVQAQGNLRYGFNTTAPSSAGCADVQNINFEIVRCLDANGNLYSCQ